MRHAKKGRKLGTDASHTEAMLRSLAIALLTHERIKTTETRAKEVRELVDRIIGWGKRGDLHARRLALAELKDRALVHKVFAEIAPRYAERPGGYTRIYRIGPRKGDAAPMVILELVD
ncbi:50S ribosomal protein L17 [Coriobacteriia bacterium Es71-Z0120]|uniref:50S ribosomal protein L17 n=1 Tax=Parvivirga hydrogeniphila TaxID=2939460 RepID=UPI0022608BA8|nr:50S ribosomal protein L17 [Parvivirga hydrogeniphila]MCL4078564.1 50S ribosomal protein L17 [Parvivirga hydrogeniphila]